MTRAASVALDMLTQAQLADTLGVSERTLEDWRYRRSGPKFVRLGRNVVRYRRSDVERWVDQRTINPDAAAS